MSPKEEAPRFFAYLDHNILDLMTKGDPLGTKSLLKKTSLIPMFSDETLKEIHGSKGHEYTTPICQHSFSRILIPTF
ncbi:MAG: hypothetical protein Q9N67_07935 [Ghiorsea sp.]|nr:hypothetical protein [Ghiorsea sp.]